MFQLILAQVTETIDEARNVVLENTTLIIALGATALVGFWIFKKVFKLALYARRHRGRRLVLVPQHQGLSRSLRTRRVRSHLPSFMPRLRRRGKTRRPTPDARRPTPDARRPTPDARRPVASSCLWRCLGRRCGRGLLRCCRARHGCLDRRRHRRQLRLSLRRWKEQGW